jgi:hypothetical protein
MPRPALRSSAVTLLLLSAALAAAGACSDRANPTAATPEGSGRGAPGGAVTVQALQCTGSRVDRTVSCAPVQPAAGGAAGVIIEGKH